MDIKADAGRRRPVDLRSHCERVDLRANSNAEAAWMAALYRAIVFGGEITVKVHKDDEPAVIEFDGMHEAEPATPGEGGGA